MSVLAATLLALAVLAAQVLHGGLFVPAFMLPSDILLILAALPGLWALVRNPSPTSPISFAAMAVLAAFFIWRCVHAPDRFLGRIELGQVLAGGLAFSIGYGALTSTRARFVFFGVVLAGAVAQAVLGFFQFAKGEMVAPFGWFALSLQAIYENRFATRAHGFFVNPNQFAWLMGWATLSCLSLATWARVHVITRLVLIYLALMFLAADMLSGSRGGLLSLVAGGLAFGLISIVGVTTMVSRGRGLVISGAVLLVALCAGFGWWVYSTNWVIQGRMDAMLFPDVRGYLLEHAQRQFEATPLLGMGPGGFIYAARIYRTSNQAYDAIFAHDDWLQTLVEYGFVGFSLALLTVFILLGGGVARFFGALRQRSLAGDRPLSNSAGILLAGITATVMFFVHSFTDFNLHIPANALLAGATLGLLAGTGGDPASGRRLPGRGLRAFTALGLVAVAAAMAFYVWRHGAADYEALRAANALADVKVASALVHADQGLKTRPDDAALLAVRARALYNLESAEEFDPATATAVGQDPKIPEVPTTEKARRALYQASADAFGAALAAQPMERSLHVGLANALVETGRRDLARAQLIEAIRLDPAHAYAYGAYGDFLYDEGLVDRALRIYSLGAGLPGGGYCGRQAESVREELTPITRGRRE